MKDSVNYPPQYRHHPSEVACIDVIEAWSFPLGSAFKCLYRCGYDGDYAHDLRKARFYVEKEIAVREKIFLRLWTGESLWCYKTDTSEKERRVIMEDHRFSGHMKYAMTSLIQAAHCPRGTDGLRTTIEKIDTMLRILNRKKKTRNTRTWA